MEVSVLSLWNFGRGRSGGICLEETADRVRAQQICPQSPLVISRVSLLASINRYAAQRCDRL